MGNEYTAEHGPAVYRAPIPGLVYRSPLHFVPHPAA